MDTTSDKFGYLRKTGALGVSHKAIAVSGSTHGAGALGSMSESKPRLAKRAKIEGNESAKYEKLEKRSLRSLKEGGSEKELRRGHNLSIGDLMDPSSPFGGGGGSDKKRRTGPTKKQLARPEWRAKHGVMAAKADVKAAKKSGGDTTAAKQALSTQKSERKNVFRTIKAARKDIREGDKDVRRGAKGVLKSAKQEAKSRFAGAYHKRMAARKARKGSDGGGGFSGLAGMF